MGEFIVGILLAMWVLFYLAFKMIGIVDDDGQIKKTSNEGIASWIEKKLKK